MSKDDRQASLPFLGGGGGPQPRPTGGEASPPKAPAPPPTAPTPPPKASAPPPTPQPSDAPAAREVLTVARLDRLIKRLLEDATADVLVQGEVSGLRRPASGHCYFSLKDERESAVIDCVMYRSAPARARKRLADGESVVLSGRATVYAPRGRMQFVAEDVLQTARGALLEALEQLKKKLAADGLFDPARKKALPPDPKTIAVLTSRDGAAVHDVIRVAHRRGGVRLIVVPTPVQGAGAGPRIARAIAQTDRLAPQLGIDAMIVTRGGGSAEDLAAYNDEQVVRAIASADTPIVSAVGHEIDVSLSDLAADARAATPSQAAELLIPDERARRQSLAQICRRLERAMAHELHARRAELAERRRELGEPKTRLRETSQRFDDLLARGERALRRGIGAQSMRLRRLRRALDAQHPRNVLTAARRRIDRHNDLIAALRTSLTTRARAVDALEPRLAGAMQRRLATERERLRIAVGRLEALSPLKVLARGYAIALDASGQAVRDAAQLTAGDEVELRLHRGRAWAQITEQEPDD